MRTTERVGVVLGILGVLMAASPVSAGDEKREDDGGARTAGARVEAGALLVEKALEFRVGQGIGTSSTGNRIFSTGRLADSNRIVGGPGFFAQNFSGLSTPGVTGLEGGEVSPNEPASLEAQIGGDVAVWHRKSFDTHEIEAGHRPGSFHWGTQAYATMMIRLRMLRSDSAPIPPPSFMPSGTLRVFGLKNSGDRHSMWVFSGMVGHHSNGQKGCPLVSQDTTECAETGEVNVATGNFSTHYVRAMARYTRIHGRDRPTFEYSFAGAVDRHVSGWGGSLDEVLRERYGMWQAFGVLELSTFPNSNYFDRIAFRMYYLHAFVAEESGNRPNNMSAIEVFLYPRGWPVSLYNRVYVGRDYYNINFETGIKRVEFGAAFSWSTLLRALPVR